MYLFYLLFFFYLLIACVFIPKIPFVKKAGLGAGLMSGLLLIKIATGCFLFWISQKYSPNTNDYWGLNNWGNIDHRLLRQDPKSFFSNILDSPYGERGGFFSSTGSYWNDLRENILIKIIALLHFLSGGNYYINSLFFNTACFFGHIGLYRVFINIYRDKKWPAIIGCFLLPSMLYFSSGIHKDCAVFTALGLFCFSAYFSLEYRVRLKYVLLGIFSFFILLLIRNYVAAAMLPPLFAWLIVKRYKVPAWKSFAAVMITGLALLVVVDQLKPAISPVKILVEKQQDFLSIDPAKSQFSNDTLQPSLISVVKATPAALNHSLMRPYVWESPGTFLQLFGLELLAYQLLVLLLTLFPDRTTGSTHAFCWFSICTALILLLFIGYITPNAGALVRYRSLYLPLLLTPVLCGINWTRIRPLNHIKNK